MYDKNTVKERFREIVPSKNLENLDILEVEKSLKISLKIIGYSPKNLEKSFEKTWKTSTATTLVDFIYECWECDYDSE